jgi:hypothetical protein
MGIENIRNHILKVLETEKDVEIPVSAFINEWTKSGPIKDNELAHKLIEFADSNGIDYVWQFPNGAHMSKAILRFWKDQYLLGM